MKQPVDTIIFFVEHPFGKRDYDRFGIEILQKNGFIVEVWDFTPFLHLNVFEEVKVSDPVDYEGHYMFFAKKEAIQRIGKLGSSVVIVCLIGYTFHSYPIYRSISRNKLSYCVFLANFSPFVVDEKGSALRKFIPKIKSITFTRLLNQLFYHLPYRIMGVTPATFVLAGGEKTTFGRYPVGKESETIWLHALDYDVYLDEKDRRICQDEKTAVFLDEYVPFTSDYLHFGVKPFSSPKEYYPFLLDFFDYIEGKYGVRIVIAAHPRSKYEEHPDYFKGRKVIRGKTVSLISQSRFVIAHCSASINYAVLFKKPVLFVTTESLTKSIQGPWIEMTASLLKKKVVNLNNKNWEMEVDEDMSVDDNAYENYKNAYIKKNGSEELPFWQILANRIKLSDV